MNKSLAKLLSSAVVLGSVFLSLQTTASPQDWQRIKRPIPAVMLLFVTREKRSLKQPHLKVILLKIYS